MGKVTLVKEIEVRRHSIRNESGHLSKEGRRLAVKVGRPLFDEPFGGPGEKCRCYLVEQTCAEKEPMLGHDPEQADLHPGERMLQALAWHTLESMRGDMQVSRVIAAIQTRETTA